VHRAAVEMLEFHGEKWGFSPKNGEKPTENRSLIDGFSGFFFQRKHVFFLPCIDEMNSRNGLTPKKVELMRKWVGF